VEAIRTIQTVTGNQLIIEVPASFSGRQVEVIVLPAEETATKEPYAPENDPRYAKYIMTPPELTEEEKKLLEENPNILHGSVLRYDDPFEPAVPPEDWEANQ
jgi:hypothetical protein